MKAMILAAGAATGLYPLTYTLPAALIPIANRPVIEHILRWLGQHGVEEAVVNLHYLHRAVSAALQREGLVSQPGLPRVEITVEPELCGTAGGVRRAADRFEETFCVVATDTVTDLDLSRMVAFHRERRALCTIAVLPRRRSADNGLLEVADDGRVLRFEENPQLSTSNLGWLNTHLYVMEREIFERIPDVHPLDFGQHIFPSLVEEQERIFAYRPELHRPVFWYDIGEPLAYRQAHRELLSSGNSIRLPGREIRPQIFVGSDCRISEEAILVPPLLLGDRVTVDAGARLEGPVVLGDGVSIGARACVSDSVLWQGTDLEGGVVVRSSLIGSSCHLVGPKPYQGILLASGARKERKSISSD